MHMTPIRASPVALMLGVFVLSTFTPTALAQDCPDSGVPATVEGCVQLAGEAGPWGLAVVEWAGLYARDYAFQVGAYVADANGVVAGYGRDVGHAAVDDAFDDEAWIVCFVFTGDCGSLSLYVPAPPFPPGPPPLPGPNPPPPPFP